ncbi:hypothetical protein [Sulfitobacter sp. S190]|uniref:hypothetical protein n=1 Tax=Sulfitobacter sp. S190 TaxID=2867022 RepID=UPI0021A45979|nr:hypothetical protein [Sulfitobacter sp. S190]UWR22939.1 hypothetical protein K3756_02765 [Sulfitobacter sp. S190]
MSSEAKRTQPAGDPPETELDADSIAAIRDLMAQTVAVDAAPVAANAPVEATAEAEAVAAPRHAPRKADSFPELEEPVAAEPVAAPRKRLSLRRTPKPPRARAKDTAAKARAPMLDKVRSYRPTRRHIILAALLLVVVLRPWLVLGLVFLSLFILAGVFLMMGYDGFWHGAMKLGRWYANRRPARAAELHRKLDAFAMRWDAVLDRFPEGTVDGLYLPDFGEMATAQARHDEAVDRRLTDLQDTNA